MVIIQKVLLLPALLLLLSSAVTLGTVHASSAERAAEAPQALEDKPFLCNADLIDVTFSFASMPAGEQTISLHLQNKSNVTCRLYGPVTVSFAADGHSMNVPICWLCEQMNNPLPFTKPRSENEILLAQGERARVDLHWASTGESCQWADWSSFFLSWAKPNIYLFIPSDWPMHICSTVKINGYWSETNAPSAGVVRNGLLHVSVMPSQVYSDEHATLHVGQVTSPTADNSSTNCGSLYVVRQSGLETRFEPLPTINSISRPSYTPEQMEEDKERPQPYGRTVRMRRCDIADGQTIADGSISAKDLTSVTHVEWRATSGPSQKPLFFATNTHFSVLDVDTLAPNWGDSVKGIQAGLSIDKASFSQDEVVPLHLRWENMNAALPLAQEECGGPNPDLEIQDSNHNVVSTISTPWGCMDHGWGPFAVEKGKPLRTFIELLTAHSTKSHLVNSVKGELPGPGVYYLVSVWSPHVLVIPPAEGNANVLNGNSNGIGAVYATARSAPVRVEITPANNQ